MYNIHYSILEASPWIISKVLKINFDFLPLILSLTLSMTIASRWSVYSFAHTPAELQQHRVCGCLGQPYSLSPPCWMGRATVRSNHLGSLSPTKITKFESCCCCQSTFWKLIENEMFILHHFCWLIFLYYLIWILVHYLREWFAMKQIW